MNRMKPLRNPRKAGFTLVELLVVLAILALLVGLVGPRVLRSLDTSKAKTAALQIAEFEKTLEIFKLDVGRFPTTEEGLNALSSKPASVATGWNGPYIKGGIPADPWGKPYIYKSPGDNGRPYDIASYGADGVAGGQDNNRDITSWEK